MSRTMPKEREAKQIATESRASAKGHHAILSLEVTAGFLKGAKLEFADGLNCIIGGRGTGKTTILEFVRYVLGRMPDPRSSPTRAKLVHSLLQSNLAGGRVRLSVQTKHGARYTTERMWGDEGQVLDERGAPTSISLDRDLIFKADIYSQNEIEEIALNPAFQLVLLDKFAEEEIRRVEAEARKVARDLEQNGGELLRLDRETRDLEDTAFEATALEERMKALQPVSGSDAARIEAAHVQRAQREAERRALETIRQDVRRIGAELDASVAAKGRNLAARLDASFTSGPNKAILEVVAGRVRELSKELEDAASKLRDACAATDGALEAQARVLGEAHAKQELEYRDVVVASQEERERSLERVQLEQRFGEVAAAKRELEHRERERATLEAQRRELETKLSNLRDERFQIRKRVAERLTESLRPIIRVSVKQAGSRQAYRDLLTEALKGSGLKYATIVEKIADSTSPDELSSFARRADAARLAERAGLDEERARKVIELLRASDLVYKVGTVELEDLPKIELLDGKDYKDSANLSTGQRCTTILPILLLESERPLLIDEPEGNLDNAFIYETIVKSLKGAKGRRQLIFVTHNPNIPVLGDAERVFVFASDGKQGRVKHAGTVDDLRGEIETLLEGGREAFLLRKQRYGH